MDDETQRKPEFYSEGSFDEVRSPLNQYAGAFFAQAKDFVINGGRFKSVTNIYRAAANDPTHFRMIPLGDLNLLHGTGHGNASSVVLQAQGRNPVRRVYAARIHGSKTKMTAVLYEGDGAEKEWRKDILQYSVLRHPNLPQLYGIVNSGRLHAAIFHDALIPYTHVQRKYRNSHFSTMFFAACMDRKFFDISQYTISLNSHQLHWSECTPWIRSSTGSLCFQLIPPQSDPARLYSVDGVKSLATDTSLFELPEDPQIITSMSLQEYHRICYMYMCQWHDVSVSTYVPIKLRSVLHLYGSDYANSSEIAHSTPVCGIVDMGWLAFSFGREGGDSDFVFPASYTSLTIAPNASIVRSQEGITTMGNGWIRINSANVADQYYRRIENDSVGIPWVSWLAQANYIFRCLGITSGFPHFAFIKGVRYYLDLSGSKATLPPGFLFLCPLADLQAEFPTSFQLPRCLAYWSLDPLGTERLSAEESIYRGFPEMKVRMDLLGRSWDGGVYAGICEFQEAKGFDPYSQEVAKALGCSLFQVSGQVDAIAPVEEGDTSGCYSDSDDVDHFKSEDELSEEESSSTESETEIHLEPQFRANNVANASHEHFEKTSASHGFDEQILTPTMGWNIIMSVQFALLFAVSALWLYEYLRHW